MKRGEDGIWRRGVERRGGEGWKMEKRRRRGEDRPLGGKEEDESLWRELELGWVTDGWMRRGVLDGEVSR